MLLHEIPINFSVFQNKIPISREKNVNLNLLNCTTAKKDSHFSLLKL